MLPQNQRLNLRNEMDFFKSAYHIQTPYFRIFWKKSNFNATASVIVPKTNQLNAVKRNKIKRKIRSVLVELLPQLKNLKVAVVGYEKILNLSTPDLRQLIFESLSRIK